MNPNATKARSIFISAVENYPPEQWDKFLDEACGQDAELKRRVVLLLNAHRGEDSFLDRGNDDPVGTPTLDLPPPENPGTPHEHEGQMIGRYKLLQAIGEGGFGSVWMAEQCKPVIRRVALKVIKLGMDTKQVIARFEAERQALAMMEHPNIAKVLDAGATDMGRPYFVMELVKGDSIVVYCDKNNLSIQERLELFAQVCAAVQHAHTKGIIHRDIKPSNILVSTQDGRPHTKVIDFGIAKATASKLTEKTLFTEHRQLIGTPEYMSPEQAEGSLDIDTRTDVYSLGVLLYELLTGSTPFSGKELRSAAYAEMQRIIREVDPPKPSTRISQSSDKLASVAAHRHTEPRRLGTIVRGELDWIVMKALEKDRQRRYETANGLAMDIRRYISGEAVVAAPPSTAYRFKKFIRRNRVMVTAGSVVAMALVLGVIGTTTGMFWALSEKNKALLAAKSEAMAKLDADQKRQEAETNLEYARKGNEVLGSVFEGLDPRQNYATVAELRNALRGNLTKATQDLEGSAIGDPLAVAEIQSTLGGSLMGLGAADQAIPLLLKARETRQARLGPDDPKTLLSMQNLAMAYWEAGQLDLALPLSEETVRRRKATLGPDHPATLASMNNLASVYSYLDQLDKAIVLFEEVLKLQTARLGRDHPDMTAVLMNLGMNYREAGRLEEAIPLLEEAIKSAKASHGPDNPNTLIVMTNLAQAYEKAGNLDLAVPLYEETINRAKARLGPDHPHTLKTQTSLAHACWQANRFDKSVSLYEEILKVKEAKLGRDHPDTLNAAANLGSNYLGVRRIDEAISLLEETFRVAKAKLGPEDPATLLSMNNLAVAYWSAARLDKSIPLLEETLKLLEVKLGRDHPNTLQTATSLGVNYRDAGRFDEAIPLLQKTLELQKTKLGPDNSATLSCMKNLAVAYWKAKQFDKSVPLFEDLLKRHEALFGRDNPNTLATVADLGVNYRDAGRIAEAIPLLEEAHRAVKNNASLEWVTLELFDAYLREDPTVSVKHWAALILTLRADLGDDHFLTMMARNNLGYSLTRSGQFDEAEAMLTETIAREVRTLGEEHMMLLQTRTNLGELYQMQGKDARAEELLRKCLVEREKKEPDSFRLASTQSMLGRVLAQQRKFAEAEPLLLSGYKGLKDNAGTTPDWGKYYLPDTLEWLTRLYEDWSKPDEAAKWQAELESITAKPAVKR